MEDQKYSSGQLYALVALRLFVGWHFLYEGVVKMYNPSWTAKGYLLSASILKPVFAWLASSSMSPIIDTLNIVALLAVGVSLLNWF
jgi:thiosulfate dehydrogenase (quinone) large subunit